MKDLVLDAMKKTFRPEFLNRIDEIIVFQQLTREEIRQIVDLMSADLQSRIKAQGMELVITDECKDFIAKDGYNPTYGARPLRRSIQRLLEDQLAEQVLQGRFREGDTITTVLEGEAFRFEKAPASTKKTKEKGEKAEKGEKGEKGSESSENGRTGEEKASAASS
jgi:ATP-dependent Clp protease ATP-binding subunit ClpC